MEKKPLESASAVSNENELIINTEEVLIATIKEEQAVTSPVAKSSAISDNVIKTRH